MIKGVGALAVLEEQNHSCSRFPSVSRVVSVTLTLKKKRTLCTKESSCQNVPRNITYTQKKCIKVTITVNLCGIWSYPEVPRSIFLCHPHLIQYVSSQETLPIITAVTLIRPSDAKMKFFFFFGFMFLCFVCWYYGLLLSALFSPKHVIYHLNCGINKLLWAIFEI
jgi:hypothetical protein